MATQSNSESYIQPEVIKLVPATCRRETTTPHRCPVCGGNGKVGQGFYSHTSGQWYSVGGTEKCRSCGGTGIVWSHEIIEHTDTKVTDLPTDDSEAKNG